MNDYMKTDGIDFFHGAKDAAAAAITDNAGSIQAIGDLGGLTGGEVFDVTNKNQVLGSGAEDVIKRVAPKKISMAPISFTIRPAAKLATYTTLSALAQLVKGYKITFPDKGATSATSLHGNAIMTECKLAGSGDDVLINITLTPTGDVWTLTPAA